jgi:hypothetical protein
MSSASNSAPLLDTPVGVESSAAVSATRTLSSAREAFVEAVRRDTPGTDLPRYVAVLDALLAWSATRSAQLAFRADAGAKNAISFVRSGTTVAFWSARPVRADAPALEIGSLSSTSLSAEARARAIATLNAHSRSVLIDGDRLRIGFGALKNTAARSAILDLLDDLLANGTSVARGDLDGASERAQAPPSSRTA